MVQTFFKRTQSKYGNSVVKSMKNLFKLKLKLAKAENKKIFLLRCRKQRVFPKTRRLRNTFNINQHVFERLESRFIFGIISQEIGENFLHIKQLIEKINRKTQLIRDVISPLFFNNFATKLERSYKIRYDLIKAKHIIKFNNIIGELNTQDGNIDTHTTDNNNASTNIDSHIDSNKWIVNLTDIEIPEKVTNILKLGEKFCPPTSAKYVPYTQIIANVEGILLDHEDTDLDKPRLRNEMVNILTNFKNRNRHKQLLTPVEAKFISDVSATKIFIKDHPNILITRADKGNTTVIVSKTDYLNKISSMLEDTNTYSVIVKENTKSIERKLNSMVTAWQKGAKITEYEAKNLRSYHGVKAKLYGLPKIHKANVPYRPIVSSIGTPLYNLSAFLSTILNKTVGKSSTAVKNSIDFKEKILDVLLPNDYVVLSLDVVSLFTNIDSQLALNIINDRWDEIERNSGTKLSKSQYIDAMKLVLYNCEFSFNNKIYKQLFGSPMGSPVSPAIADLVMEFVESSVLSSLDYTPAFFYRYVDDIITAIPKDKLEHFFQTFNEFNSNIKFTMELETENKLAFLDLIIIRSNNGSLKTNWFHKDTWSGRYLNFDSHLPLSYKRNTVKLLANKILKLSDSNFHHDNFRLLKNTLRNNGYPNSFLNPILNSILYKNLNQPVEIVSSVANTNLKYVSIPYVKSLHEQLRFCLNKYNLQVVGRAHNNFGKTLFSRLKDPTMIGDNKNVVYKIICDCNKTYFGQTTQLLSTRVCQHKRDAQKLTLGKTNREATSALTSHLFDSKHDIYLDNVRVVEREANQSTRRVLEMIHIKMNPNSINKQSDCTYLQNTYNNLF